MPSTPYKRRRNNQTATSGRSDHTEPSQQAPRSTTRFYKMVIVYGLILASLAVWYSRSASSSGRRVELKNATPAVEEEAKYYDYEVLEVMPHDASCFTQGLEYDPYDGALLESCGWLKESRILRDGKVIYRFKDDEFAEGITVAEKGKIHALTWRNKRAYVIDAVSGEELKSVEYPRIGWGLAYNPDDKVLYASDGSSTLYTLRVEDFRDLSNCRVMADIGDGKDRPVGMLNELEWIDGTLYANIFMAVIPPTYPYYIVAIDPATCRVTKILNLRGIHQPTGDLFNFVMNGIAKPRGTEESYGSNAKELIITGKRWDKMYRIAVKDMDMNRRRPKSHNQYPITDFITRDSF
ncbi:hypothetical protein FOZ60_005343 [Perkinsus olseni]|uniref:Uncharacterized protein n=1 Tax=Perkinsus olseni TaxID=32597 RepID=A0A7J6NR80_PEROL|nr:hypothetical protein FOZ60_005343 [Perkinsus olseni]